MEKSSSTRVPFCSALFFIRQARAIILGSCAAAKLSIKRCETVKHVASRSILFWEHPSVAIRCDFNLLSWIMIWRPLAKANHNLSPWKLIVSTSSILSELNIKTQILNLKWLGCNWGKSAWWRILPFRDAEGMEFQIQLKVFVRGKGYSTIR